MFVFKVMLKGFRGGYILNEALLFDEQVNSFNDDRVKERIYKERYELQTAI